MLGRLAMKIDTDVSMNFISDWKPDLDFMLVPAPMPQDRLAPGEPVAWSAAGTTLVVHRRRSRTRCLRADQVPAVVGSGAARAGGQAGAAAGGGPAVFSRDRGQSRRPQRRGPGRRGARPVHDPGRPALQHGGRLPAAGGRARQRRRHHERPRLPDPVRGRPGGRRGVPARRPAPEREGGARGPRVRGRLPLAAAAHALRDRARGPHRADGHRGAPRPAGRREPPGPPGLLPAVAERGAEHALRLLAGGGGAVRGRRHRAR